MVQFDQLQLACIAGYCLNVSFNNTAMPIHSETSTDGSKARLVVLLRPRQRVSVPTGWPRQVGRSKTGHHRDQEENPLSVEHEASTEMCKSVYILSKLCVCPIMYLKSTFQLL